MTTHPRARDRRHPQHHTGISAAHWLGFAAVVIPLALWAAHHNLDPCDHPSHPRLQELCL